MTTENKRLERFETIGMYIMFGAFMACAFALIGSAIWGVFIA